MAAAYQLPRSAAGRPEAIASALAGAARPPADVVRLALRLIPLAEELLAGGNRNVITDVGAAAEAARAAAVTARLNIEVNLRGITDAALRDELAETAGVADTVVGAGGRDRGGGPGGDHAMSPGRELGGRELGGRELAAAIRAAVAERAAELAAAGRPPRLAVVTATADEASAWYVRSLGRAAAKAGIACDVTDLVPDSPAGRRRRRFRSSGRTLAALSGDPRVHGILLQTPLPGGARLADLAGGIDPAKDVDGANPVSLGRLMTGLPAFAPATAAAVLALLDHHEVALSGRRAVVVGRSAVVGKPVAQLLLARDATVTVCHSRTADLAAVTSSAEILVVAAGRAGLIGPGFVGAGGCGGGRGDQCHGGRRDGRGCGSRRWRRWRGR